ncbi:MAG TPA: metal-dependent transcriptional regulator [Phycisphaerae bacterium]|nr:metal-dependent transcriptional regulator [Phycisphaerae bacterium]
MRSATRKLTASQEDYLEAILALLAERGAARVRDIARRLRVAMPSVTRALGALARRGLVNYAPYEQATLTDRGRELAEGVRSQHRVLVRFLTEVLGLDAKAADANACRMEHAVDESVLRRIKDLQEFVSGGSVAARALRAELRRRSRRRRTS